MNVLYDEEGNQYPVDDAGQLYVPLTSDNVMGVQQIEEENTVNQQTN